MKTKKMFLTTVILIVAVVAMAIYSVVSSIALKPTITESEFDFSVTYELNGETMTIEDVLSAKYERNGGYTNTKSRIYSGTIGSMEKGNTMYVLQENAGGRIELNTKLYPDYLMGDPMYEYFNDETFEPEIYYYDTTETEYEDEETLAAQGVKLISWEYPTPIENKLVFSHISNMDSSVVIPTVLIGVLALIVVIIFVKKDSEFVRMPIDRASTVLNFLAVFIAVPFLSVLAMVLDIAGDNAHFLTQASYFIPAITVLSVAASVGLRRKNYKKGSLWTTLIGVSIVALLMVYGLLS